MDFGVKEICKFVFLGKNRGWMNHAQTNKNMSDREGGRSDFNLTSVRHTHSPWVYRYLLMLANESQLPPKTQTRQEPKGMVHMHPHTPFTRLMWLLSHVCRRRKWSDQKARWPWGVIIYVWFWVPGYYCFVCSSVGPLRHKRSFKQRK